MDRHIEELVIKAFLLECKRERALYELGNDKKRGNFLFSFQGTSYFQAGCMKRIHEHISSYQQLYEILKKNGAPDTCYVMKAHSPLDGQVVPLKQGVEDALFDGPALLSCAHGSLAFLEGEHPGAGFGIPDRFLLVKQRGREA